MTHWEDVAAGAALALTIYALPWVLTMLVG